MKEKKKNFLQENWFLKRQLSCLQYFTVFDLLCIPDHGSINNKNLKISIKRAKGQAKKDLVEFKKSWDFIAKSVGSIEGLNQI